MYSPTGGDTAEIGLQSKKNGAYMSYASCRSQYAGYFSAIRFNKGQTVRVTSKSSGTNVNVYEYQS